MRRARHVDDARVVWPSADPSWGRRARLRTNVLGPLLIDNDIDHRRLGLLSIAPAGSCVDAAIVGVGGGSHEPRKVSRRVYVV